MFCDNVLRNLSHVYFSTAGFSFLPPSHITGTVAIPKSTQIFEKQKRGYIGTI